MTRTIFLTLACLGGYSAPGLAQAVAWPDCAPWDGAATRIAIPQIPGADSGSQVTLSLALYQAPEQLRGQSWQITTGSTNRLAVSLCSAGGACQFAGSGWVRMERGAVGSELRGSYRITLPDGRTLASSFSAPLRARRTMCG